MIEYESLSAASGAYVGQNRPVDETTTEDDYTLEKALAMGCKHILWDGMYAFRLSIPL